MKVSEKYTLTQKNLLFLVLVSQSVFKWYNSFKYLGNLNSMLLALY